MKIILSILYFALSPAFLLAAPDEFGLTDPTVTLTNSKGEGSRELYGTTHFRALLKNVVYLGGSNNLYLKPRPRPYESPLAPSGLKNLCEESFSLALSLNNLGENSEPRETRCWTPSGRSRILLSQTSLTENGIQALFEIIYAHVQDSKKGNLFIYDWDGRKETSFTGALILKQFCGWSGVQALDYFRKTTNALPGEIPNLESLIRDFIPWNHFKILPEKQDEICF